MPNPINRTIEITSPLFGPRVGIVALGTLLFGVYVAAYHGYAWAALVAATLLVVVNADIRVSVDLAGHDPDAEP